MKLLQIDSSARQYSVSRQLTASFVTAWKSENPEGEVIRRDLAATPFPLLTDEWLQAVYRSPDQRTEDQRLLLSLSETLIDELIDSQTIVVGSPMYNFTISSLLMDRSDRAPRKDRDIRTWWSEGALDGQEGRRAYRPRWCVFKWISQGRIRLPGSLSSSYPCLHRTDRADI
jgi:FMN-dependent NADH-azoreductase